MRIVTRPDFDGVVCAVLLSDALRIKKPVKWVEPNAVQMGRVEIRKGDIIANLPYDDRCSFWFDHHYTNRIYRSFRGVFKIAPSAAGIIFEYYRQRFQRDFSELAAAADKIDAADLTLDEVEHPEKYDYVLLSMTVSNGEDIDDAYRDRLVDLLQQFDRRQVMQDPAVQQRCQEVIRQNETYREALKACTRIQGGVAVTDFRPLGRVPAGNRFLVYSLFPEAVVQVKIRYEDEDRETVVVHVGHSIFNRGCNVNAGLLLAEFGGGGHRAAASTRFAARRVDEYLPHILDVLLKNSSNET